MKIDHYEFTRRFTKRLAEAPARRQTKVKETLKLAAADLSDPRLRFHELKGQLTGTQSISVGGDMRIHLQLHRSGDVVTATLLTLGTHAQLYE
ncbi:MAG: hypothetical protein FWF28_00245 [Micrococcales bacterium]|nr:hypothetical protein [Micrococcales bacterium]